MTGHGIARRETFDDPGTPRTREQLSHLEAISYWFWCSIRFLIWVVAPILIWGFIVSLAWRWF